MNRAGKAAVADLVIAPAPALGGGQIDGEADIRSRNGMGRSADPADAGGDSGAFDDRLVEFQPCEGGAAIIRRRVAERQKQRQPGEEVRQRDRLPTRI
ncbi:hypothetical protein [Sphingopyxis sp. H050]|jgi:hypothetical protein|uniref:hypothetical protein n=1 Tax=Sphingopyxis sp. H050 TaxID=1759072 RepID=UPI0012E3965C|nr:hypothetical protein [Sphingopyxis sp. H050]